MGEIKSFADEVYRDFVTAGVPASGAFEPPKTGIRSLWGRTDAALSSIGAGLALGNAILKGDLASLNADLAHADGTLAVVFNDANTASDGVYVKIGASGSGSWARTSLTLPAGYLDSIATDIATEGRNARSDAAGFATVWTIRRKDFRGNLFDPVRGIPNTAVYGVSGGTYSSSGVTATGLIAVEPGSTIISNKPMRSFAFYAINGSTFISGREPGFPEGAPVSGNLAANTVVNVPAGAYWFQTDAPTADILGVHATRTPPLYIGAEGSVPVLVRPLGYPLSSKWSGKKIGTLADSQFYRNPGFSVTQEAYCRDLGAIDRPFPSDAVGGRKWADTLPYITTDNIGDIDLLLLLLGANDWDVPDGNPLGSYSDSNTATSCVGDMRRVYEKIRSVNPSVRIITLLQNKRGSTSGIAPGQPGYVKRWPDANSVGKTLEDYVDMIARVSADYGSAKIDLFREFDFCDATFDYYSDDRIHLNYSVGQPALADFLSGRLRSI